MIRLPALLRTLGLVGVGVLLLSMSAVALPEQVARAHNDYYFDNPAYLDMADSVLERTRRELIRLVRDSLDYRAQVYLVESLEEFRELIRGKFPDWGAAAAFPPRHRIVIKSPDKFNLGKPLGMLLMHEYTHLVISHRTGLFDAPRWFEEGMAQYVSTEWSWSDNVAVSLATVTNQFIPLHDIEQLNRFNEAKAQVAYSESYIAVKYLFDTYGIESVNKFLDEIRRGGSFDEALTVSTGANYAEFETEFQTYWRSRFNVVTILADTMWLWLLLALIVVIGAFLRYRKRREYYKKWEREEKYQSTDFDYGDPDRPEEADDDEPWRH